MVVVVCALLAVPVWSADGDKAVAKAHFEAATRLYDIHEYAKALDEYKAAYLAKPDPAFLFNVGQCYRRLGKFDQALDFYREYLKKAPPDDPNRPNVEARIRNTDTGDVFETDTPRPVSQPAQPPIPPQAPPVQRAPTGPEMPPVAEPGIGQAGQKPSSEVESSVSVGQPSQAPRLPASAESAVVTPAGLDLTTVAPAGQVSAGTPFYGRWWFWTGVGAAVVAGTVAAIVIAKSGNDGNKASTVLGTQSVFQ
jgi:tetratricopeptide (TPR) repeat protein